MGPNKNKAGNRRSGNRNNAAGELEEEESAGTALMPQPMKAGGVLAVLEAGGLKMFKKPAAQEERPTQ